MVQTLFITASAERNVSFQRAFSHIGEWTYQSATSLVRALDTLLTRSIDIILLDLQAPIRGLKQFLKAVKIRFPETYRIVIRAPRFQVHHRYYLEQAHSSFVQPYNLQEVRNIIRKINIFCPVTEEFEEVEIKAPETVEQQLVPDTECIGLYKDLCRPKCTQASVLERVVTHRELSHLVLKRINSSHYGLNKKVHSVGRAIKLMGTEGVRELLEENYGDSLADELEPLSFAG